MALHWKIVIGLVLGVIVGLVINSAWDAGTWRAMGVSNAKDFLAGRPTPPVVVLPDGVNDPAAVPPERRVERTPTFGARAVRFLVNLNDFVGQLFLRCLRFVAVPIVLFSLIVGAASLGDIRKVGRIGLAAIGVFLMTTAFAVTIGLTIANVVRPGRYVSAEVQAQLTADNAKAVEEAVAKTGQVQSIWRQVLDMIPENPFQALATASMLQVIVAGIALGIALTLVPREKSAPAVAFFDAMSDAVVTLINAIMLLAPAAVFALMVPKVALLGLSVLGALGMYALVVLAGLAIVLFVEYPLLLRLLGGVGFVRFFRAMAPAQLLAFSSSSSSATLPVTLRCATARLGVPPRIAGFVCPLGATVNMDGTALYQGVATVFIAQLSGIDLGLAAQLTIVLMAVLASIGTPGIPGAGVVMLVVVLESVGVPVEGIAVILAVDRVLDMCRTVVNVTGDAMTAAIVARREGLKLEPQVAE